MTEQSIELEKKSFSNGNYSKLNQVLSSALLIIPGLLFFLVNSIVFNFFYRVNELRICLYTLAALSLFLLYDVVQLPKSREKMPNIFSLWLFLSIPFLGTIPGFFVNGGDTNFYLPVELVTHLIIIIWAGYLYRGMQKLDDLFFFFLFIVVTVFYVSALLILVKYKLISIPWMPGLSSTFGNKNYFSGFLIILLPFILSLILSGTFNNNTDSSSSNKKKIFLNLFYLITFAIGMIALFYAQSRVAIFSTLASITLMLFFYQKLFGSFSLKKRYLALTALLIAFVILFSDNTELRRKIFEVFTSDGWGPRVVPWKTAISSIKKALFFGYGPGSSYNLFYKFLAPDSRLVITFLNYAHTHSEILEVTQEGGLFGLILYTGFWLFLGYLLFKIIRDKSNKEYIRKISLGIACGLLGFHIQGMFEVTPRMISVKFTAWILVILTIILYKICYGPNIFTLPLKRQGKWSFLVCNALLISLLGFVTVPWLKSSHDLLLFLRQPVNENQILKMTDEIKSISDVYIVYSLLLKHLKKNDLDRAEITIKRLDQIIPNYRETNYIKALIEMKRGNIQKAETLALLAQRKDSYQINTIILLAKIAISTLNFNLLEEQIDLLTKRYVVRSKLIPYSSAGKISVVIEQNQIPLQINKTPETIQIVWSDRLLNALFQSTSEESNAREGFKNLFTLRQSIVKSNFIKGEEKDIQEKKKAFVDGFLRTLGKVFAT